MRSTFDARIITPQAVETIENISFFRAEDRSGSFGILPRHIEFLTTLEPSIAIAVIEEREHYYAFNGGVLSFKSNALTITAKEFVQSDKVSELLEMIKRSFKAQEEKERRFSDNIENLQSVYQKTDRDGERSWIEKRERKVSKEY